MEIAVLVLAGTLAVSCVAVVALCVALMLRHSDRWGESAEVIVRHQDKAIEYQRKALADAAASARQRMDLASASPQEGLSGPARSLSGAGTAMAQQIAELTGE